ncbi:serine threonine- kinase [Chlorella sorokiniana]|uniref:Serine threonine-kinase n=1 Tax=Chlorella sorokiniana TaxID=3076 RepID=A0A2P6TUQ6_CHLSO|nr:serine threonine- kinase [Chlorella sorokiniana]|eukprot:PRW57781.1 serine threonine- kinase [Chlorella sorokiniana]
MWFPDGRDYPGAGRPVVLLKGGPGAGPMDIADANINLNAVLYRKKAAAGTAAGSSGGGLSAGAVAGIAVAAASAQSLLSQLPTYGWQRCLVDYAAIQFVGDGDGQPVVLGEGASATVYQVLLNGVEPHAAKVFRLGSDPRAQLDFLEEASLLRLLRHRSVVGFAGVCVARGHGIILMELMEGGDLRSRNAEVDEWGLRRFGWYQRGKTVALDIATAMHYLHSSSYTHFDIKSRNVLLSRDLTAKLADVGFTRAMRTTHHSVEGPIGTLDYMAPELLLNNSKCTNAVDTYSFGCLLHEICTGKYPSRGCLRDIHVPLEAPAEVAALVAACLQEDPARRPTARQLVQALMDLQ